MSKKSIDMKLLKENVKQGEKIELPKFIDHVSKGTIVDNFSILVGTQLLIVRAEQPGEILLPFSEHHGDHDMNYIVMWNDIEKREIFRKNIRSIEMITWKK